MPNRQTSLRLTVEQKKTWKLRAKEERRSKNQFLAAQLDRVTAASIKNFERHSLGQGEGRCQVTFSISQEVDDRIEDLVKSGVAPSRAHVIDSLIEL